MKTALLALLLILLPGLTLRAAETALEFDPAQTQVQFTLSDVLHTVHGRFRLKRGAIRYDFATGQASGEIVIDAQSGDSGSGARDSRMHKNVLESGRFPEIVFLPDHVEGSLSSATVHGKFRIHGADHDMTMTVTAADDGPKMDIRTKFSVPYVDWGMKDPSTFVLKVGKTVDIDIHATGAAR